MKLSAILGQVPDYLEYAWVVAPNAAAQSITANTVTTLTIDTEVADYGNHGSIAGNQITLAPGTYYFEAYTNAAPASNVSVTSCLSLYNVTAASYISRSATQSVSVASGTFIERIYVNGQFVINATSAFDLRLIANGATTIKESPQGVSFTLSTAGTSQRTTLKLWKLL